MQSRLEDGQNQDDNSENLIYLSRLFGGGENIFKRCGRGDIWEATRTVQ